MNLRSNDEHAKIAGTVLSVLKKDGLMIPAKQARQFIEMEDWLLAIKEGKLMVVEVNDPSAQTPVS